MVGFLLPMKTSPIDRARGNSIGGREDPVGKKLNFEAEIKANQGKEAGAKGIEQLEPKTAAKSPIETYIQGFEGEKRAKLDEIYALIKAEAPGATEKLSYGMPTFFLDENLVHFAAQARHLGFYPTPSGIEAFEEELGAYRYSKGAIQFPYDQDLPRALIRKLVRFRVREVEEKSGDRKLSKK
jgi:uncharacterized protein YdhG (YjbR/CyaY superfamily)